MPVGWPPSSFFACTTTDLPKTGLNCPEIEKVSSVKVVSTLPLESDIKFPKEPACLFFSGGRACGKPSGLKWPPALFPSCERISPNS